MARTFFYRLDTTNHEARTAYIFRVWHTSQPAESDEFFELGLVSVADKTLMIHVIANHGDSRLRAMGIGDSLIPLAARLLASTILSSSNTHLVLRKEVRTPAATKLWQRLVARGYALYDPIDDRFSTTPRAAEDQV